MANDTHAPAGEARALLVDSRAAARMLSISERTLHSLAVAGVVPSVKLGRRRLYSPASLAEWVASQAGGPER